MSDETAAVDLETYDEGLSLLDSLVPLAEHFGPLVAGLAAPQQQQSAAASALASVGALLGLAGAAANTKSPTDQHVALMQSATELG